MRVCVYGCVRVRENTYGCVEMYITLPFQHVLCCLFIFCITHESVMMVKTFVELDSD